MKLVAIGALVLAGCGARTERAGDASPLACETSVYIGGINRVRLVCRDEARDLTLRLHLENGRSDRPELALTEGWRLGAFSRCRERSTSLGNVTECEDAAAVRGVIHVDRTITADVRGTFPERHLGEPDESLSVRDLPLEW